MFSEDSQFLRRLRKLTERAQEIYDDKVRNSYKTLYEIKCCIEESMKYINKYQDNLTVLKELREIILEAVNIYHS